MDIHSLLGVSNKKPSPAKKTSLDQQKVPFWFTVAESVIAPYTLKYKDSHL